MPAGHALQSDKAVKPVALEELPAGQGCGRELPSGQKEPSGQICASMVDAFGQKKPEGHFPAQLELT